MCALTNRWGSDGPGQPEAGTALAPVFALALLIGLVLLAPAVAAADKAAGTAASTAAGTAGESDPVHITADRLIAESRESTAEFIGRVRAVQGTTVITADRLKIFYRSKDGETAQRPAGNDPAGAIEKIVCIGQVKILFDDKVAVSPKAVYTADNGVLVLSGPGTTVTSGKNTVSGETVTVFRNEDRMMVESGGKKRVEAVLFSRGKGLK